MEHPRTLNPKACRTARQSLTLAAFSSGVTDLLRSWKPLGRCSFWATFLLSL